MSTVLTPLGQYSASDVLEIPKGGQIQHVGDEIHLIDASGQVLHRARGGTQENKSSTVEPSEASSIAFAFWVKPSGPPISTFSATWTVPNAPGNYNGETLFLFNSLGSTYGGVAVLPVLQFGVSGAGGGDHWSIATWYITRNSAYFTPLVRVEVGQPLVGIILLNGQQTDSRAHSTKYNYHVYFANIPGAESLEIGGSQELVRTTLTLASYNAHNRSNYPNGSTSFRPINIDTLGGVPPVHWTPGNDGSSGITATVDIPGTGFDDEVTIRYIKGVVTNVKA